MRESGRLFVPWLLFAAVCTFFMWAFPGKETVPYHVAWIAVAVAYGFEAWPLGRALTGIAAYTVATGGILVWRAATGVIAWEETTEIPLMSVLMLLVIWHVRRRHVAFARLQALSERDRNRTAHRERLSRMTSHEMRTPATIASGYAELLLSEEVDPAKRADLEVIRDELGRLVLASERLVRMISIADQDVVGEVDVDRLVHATAERWSVVSDREWSIAADAGRQRCAADRLRACLDTLLENAVRYTEPGGAVRIGAAVHGPSLLVWVADSGPGLDDALAQALNSGASELEAHRAYVAEDPKARTGFGLALVREAAEALGWRVAAGRSAEGGALLLLVLPRSEEPAASSPAPLPPVGLGVHPAGSG